MKNAVQSGMVITHTATAAIASGDIVELGTLYGVAATKAAIGEQVELALVGVYKVKNPDAVAVTKGALIGIDLAAQKIVAAGGGDVDMVAFDAPGTTNDVPVLLPLGPGLAGC